MSASSEMIDIPNLAIVAEIKRTRAIFEERGFKLNQLERLEAVTVEVGADDLGQRQFLAMEPWVLSLAEIDSSGVNLIAGSTLSDTVEN